MFDFYGASYILMYRYKEPSINWSQITFSSLTSPIICPRVIINFSSALSISLYRHADPQFSSPSAFMYPSDFHIFRLPGNWYCMYTIYIYTKHLHNVLPFPRYRMLVSCLMFSELTHIAPRVLD